MGDAVMAQLKWDFLMAGIMPFFSICAIGYWIAASLYQKRQSRCRRRMVRALAEVDRYLNHASQVPVLRRSMLSEPLQLGLMAHSESRELLRQHSQGDGPSAPFTVTGAVHGNDRTTLRSSWTETRFGSQAGHKAVELEKVGTTLGHLDALCRLAAKVGLEASDWRAFRRDVLDLTSPELSYKQKLHVIAAMRFTYNVF